MWFQEQSSFSLTTGNSGNVNNTPEFVLPRGKGAALFPRPYPPHLPLIGYGPCLWGGGGAFLSDKGNPSGRGAGVSGPTPTMGGGGGLAYEGVQETGEREPQPGQPWG